MASPTKTPAKILPPKPVDKVPRGHAKRIEFQTVHKPPQKAALMKHLNMNHPDTKQAAAPAQSSTTTTPTA